MNLDGKWHPSSLGSWSRVVTDGAGLVQQNTGHIPIDGHDTVMLSNTACRALAEKDFELSLATYRKCAVVSRGLVGLPITRPSPADMGCTSPRALGALSLKIAPLEAAGGSEPAREPVAGRCAHLTHVGPLSSTTHR